MEDGQESRQFLLLDVRPEKSSQTTIVPAIAQA
jgi:hypothetical protein